MYCLYTRVKCEAFEKPVCAATLPTGKSVFCRVRCASRIRALFKYCMGGMPNVFLKEARR